MIDQRRLRMIEAAAEEAADALPEQQAHNLGSMDEAAAYVRAFVARLVVGAELAPEVLFDADQLAAALKRERGAA